MIKVEEISAAISYIRNTITQSTTSPVVLMGFSTGCQDCFHYLVSPVTSASTRPNISGVILQAPVSDREAILHDVDTNPKARSAYEEALFIASSAPKAKHQTTILPVNVMTPLFGPAPVSIARFLSLASPESPANPSMDDYFSSDLYDQRLHDTFGRIGSLNHLLPCQADGKRSILMLEGAVDQSIPPSVDKALLLSRWKKTIEQSGNATLSSHSTVIPHAGHDIPAHPWKQEKRGWLNCAVQSLVIWETPSVEMASALESMMITSIHHGQYGIEIGRHLREKPKLQYQKAWTSQSFDLQAPTRYTGKSC